MVIDKSLPHLHVGLPLEEAEGPKTTWERSILLVTAITLHNIPEGLAVAWRSEEWRRVWDRRTGTCHRLDGGYRHPELS